MVQDESAQGGCKKLLGNQSKRAMIKHLKISINPTYTQDTCTDK